MSKAFGFQAKSTSLLASHHLQLFAMALCAARGIQFSSGKSRKENLSGRRLRGVPLDGSLGFRGDALASRKPNWLVERDGAIVLAPRVEFDPKIVFYESGGMSGGEKIWNFSSPASRANSLKCNGVRETMSPLSTDDFSFSEVLSF